MRILVIGSGGREHALATTLAKSPLAKKIYCAPGNAGTSEIAENIDIAADNINELVAFAQKNNIDLVVPGPELPLTLGITDAMQKAGILCFGPDAYCAKMEGSKSFAKEIMARAGVPTARAKTFTDRASAQEYLKKLGGPAVIKADGLAAGKGVIVADTLAEALAAVDELAKPGQTILIEEKLQGEEVSLLCLCSGENATPLPSAQDHKAVFDGDKGPNTGGMGAYSPAPVLPDARLEEMTDLVIRPVLKELAARGHPFTGVLYAGLMMTPDGPKVLEYNVRFGDPECQVILPRMQSDLAQHMLDCLNAETTAAKPVYKDDSCLGVVLAAEGYPGAYEKGHAIAGIDQAETDKNVKVFHSGTIKKDGLRSNGGRVLCITALGPTLAEARQKAYSATEKIKMPRSHYRKDIGKKGLQRQE